MANLVSGRYEAALPSPATNPGAAVPLLVDAYGRLVLSGQTQTQLVDQYGNPLSFDFDLKVDFAANSTALQIHQLILAELRAIRLAVATLAAEGKQVSVDDFDPGLFDADSTMNLS